ncbi:MAG: prepilin-type N-terminal cleavage/methylation domain-containing protein [Phycisphaerales bacterium]|nr:prepilin-type N-terminal cleavage/methylation domain-containing protein [Phycisphaerales bacterium]
MRDRAFTLIEILIVLALFVVMLSLVGPALLHRIAPMTFDRTVEQLESALLLAREDARRTGAIVYVYAERDDIDGVTRLVSRPTPLDEGAGRDPVFAAESAGEFGPMAIDQEPGVHLLTLPARSRLDHEAPRSEPGDDDLFPRHESAGPSMRPGTPAGIDGDPRAEMFGFDPEDSPSTPDLVLVCLPDGSLLLPRPTWLVDAASRAAAVRVDGAIGVVRVVPIKPHRPEDDFAGQTIENRALPAPAGTLTETRP